MRLPWVSREAYDERGRANALLTEALGKAVDRNVDLTAALLRSQRLGVPPLMPDRTSDLITHSDGGTPVNVPRETSPPDELRALIDEKCGPSLRRRAIMLRQLAADRAAGITDEKIQVAIENGIATEGVPA